MLQMNFICLDLPPWKFCGKKTGHPKARSAAWPHESHIKEFAKAPQRHCLTRSLRDPGGPCTKSMEVSESRMERVNNVLTLKNMSCMSLHVISVFDEV